MEAIEYLSYLGVTTVRIMGLEPHVCEAGSTIDSQCWCRTSLNLLCQDQPSVVYPGIPHPSYGTQAELRSLLLQLQNYNIQSVLDMDLSQFSTSSDWYNYDGSASLTSFGSLFDSTGAYTYEGRTCNRPNLSTDSVTRSLLQTMLRRFVNSIGFSGFWWRGLLCLRLISEQCESGRGSDNTAGVAFLRSFSSDGWLQFGEDTRGEVSVENPSSMIQNIADATSARGLGYDGQVDISM